MKITSKRSLLSTDLLIAGLLASILVIALLQAEQTFIVRAQPAYDCATVSEIPQAECEALVALYNATGGEQWTSKTDWLTTNTPCTWFGVQCSGGHVEGLEIYANNLTGAVPAEIAQLSNLKKCWLSRNKLTSLPPQIGNLIALESFDISGNQLSVLPPEIGSLSALQSLVIDNNKLTSLPPQIGGLQALRTLFSYSNQLAGLPSEIGSLSALQELYLSGNKLTSLPPQIGNLQTLRVLWLDGNQLASLPSEIGGLSNLYWLNLDNNLLSNLPQEIGNLNALQSLGLNRNQLTRLPPDINKLSGLQTLYLARNQLANLPDISSLANLYELRVNNNPLGGALPNFLAGLTKLDTFTFYKTQWCVPSAGSVADWYKNVVYVQGTGLVCAQETGKISGQVSRPDLAPAPGIRVFLYRLLGNPWHPWDKEWLPLANTLTNPDGSYQFDELGEGVEYGVHFVDPTQQYAPQYYDNTPAISQAAAVTTTLGNTRAGINATLVNPQPPVALVEAKMGSVTYNPDGSANTNVFRGQATDVQITLTITCTGSVVPVDVNLILTPPGTAYPMSSLGNDEYRGVIPAADVTGSAEITSAYTCNSEPSDKTISYLTLHDPSGIITDASSGEPVVGATVKLFYVPDWIVRSGPTDTRPDTCESNNSKAAGVPWSQPAPTDLGIIANAEVTLIAPLTAYQKTNALGYYGWDVSEGCWYVEVQASGYAPRVSPVVGVPPAVTDLHLTLTPGISVYLPLTMR